jgi:hypothetical protein
LEQCFLLLHLEQDQLLLLLRNSQMPPNGDGVWQKQPLHV